MRSIPKIATIVLLIALSAGFAHAGNDSLRVHLSTGGTVSYSLEDIQKITFNLTGVSEQGLERLGKSFKALMLMQNRPNPFSTRSTIAYQLPRDGRIDLKIYNLSGQLVRTLVGGEQKAGTHQVEWDGRNAEGKKVANGLYLYQIESNGKSIAKKLLIIR